MDKLKKIKGGLKNKGFRNAPWDKLEKSSNESDGCAKSDQMSGGGAKKISSDHVHHGNAKKPQ